MATAGILQAANVVFYHPLDDFVEGAVGQTWTGSAGFTTGKIGSANSAVAGDAFTFGGNQTAAAGEGADALDIIAMSATSIVVTYTVGDDMNFRVGTISGTDVTYGTAVSPRVGIRGSMSVLDATRFVAVMHALAAGGSGHAFVGTVSGTDVTFGAETAYGGTVEDTSFHSVAVLSSTKFVVHWWQPNSGILAIAGSVSGTSITVGSFIVVSANIGRTSAVGLTSSTAVLAHVQSGSVRVHVATVSGLNITVGPDTAPSNSSTFIFAHSLIALTATSVVMVHGGTVGGNAGTVSGTSITWGVSFSLFAPSLLTNGITAARLDSTRFVAAVRQEGDQFHTQIQVGTVSGNSVTVGSSSSPSTAFNSTRAQAVALTTSKIAVVHAEGAADVRVNVGSLDLSASISAPTPAAYPSTIGDDRLVVAMWAKNPTDGTTTVLVERGYAVTLASASISLGGATVVWSGGGIGTLMTSMNDGFDHFLVLDFVNEGGTTWRLRTSIDGAAFVDQGTQTSGTQAVTTADTAPALTLTDATLGGTGQWIDELVMWAGDKATFELFTTQELANLNDLADTFGEAMDQYEENFGAPICWQATARMPNGTVWRDSGSGPCPPVVRVPRGAEDIVVTDDGCPASPRIAEG